METRVPRTCVEGLHFAKGKIADTPPAVRRPSQHTVMVDDQLAIPRHPDIKFDHIRPGFSGHPEGGHRVLRGRSGTASVRHHQRPLFSLQDHCFPEPRSKTLISRLTISMDPAPST